MAAGIEAGRNGCPLQGAVQTLGEIGGVVPIVHSTAGCSVQNYLANRAGGPDDGFVSGYDVPATAVQERHVIFGGASRLREQIKNTKKVLEGELYVVLNSCESAMVGDDIDAMTKEAHQQGDPVIDSILAGFHGDVHRGYANVMTDLFVKLPTVKKEPVEKDTRRINLLGVLPQQDLTWQGDLLELKAILSAAGYEALTFFGSDGLSELSKAAGAGLTITFSDWGVPAAEALEGAYGIPILKEAALPLGVEDVRALLLRVAEAVPAEEAQRDDLLAAAERTRTELFSRITKRAVDLRPDRRLAIVAEEGAARRFASFLSKRFGARVRTLIVTDFYATDEHPAEEKRKELSGLAEEILLTQDKREIERAIRRSGAELVLGSSLEEEIAKATGATLLPVSYPAKGRTYLSRTYAGLKGELTFTEDYLIALAEQTKRREEAFFALLPEAV